MVSHDGIKHDLKKKLCCYIIYIFQKLYDFLIIERKKNILSWKNVKYKSESSGFFKSSALQMSRVGQWEAVSIYIKVVFISCTLFLKYYKIYF